MGIARLLEAGVGLRSKDEENPGRPPLASSASGGCTSQGEPSPCSGPPGPVGVVCPYSRCTAWPVGSLTDAT